MIIGRGLIANAFAGAFASAPEVVIFASGVSDSGETRPEAFEREEHLLARSQAERPALLVYFSTCSVEDRERADTAYVRHKLRMEARARETDHIVFRLPQLVGHTPNPSTLTNYLYARIASGAPFAVWKNAWRNIIDVADMARIAGHMIADERCRNRTLNVGCPEPVRVVDLVAIFERVLGVTAVFEQIDRGGRYGIDVAEAVRVAKGIGIEFGPDYVENVIRHYYGHSGTAP
jgi:nucleoside-diphosphate-sugar epimerase